MVSLKIHDKALMLIERGDVSLELVQGSRVMASVASFDGIDEYTVTLWRDQWRCDCQARKACSHIHAVALVTTETHRLSDHDKVSGPEHHRSRKRA